MLLQKTKEIDQRRGAKEVKSMKSATPATGSRLSALLDAVSTSR